MTHADFGLALTVFLIVAVFILSIRFGSYRQELKKHQRYPLFKVRDDWVYLVAQGKIRKDDPLFVNFYDVINTMLKYSSDLTLRSLIAAVRQNRDQEGNAVLEKEIQELLSHLPKYDKAVLVVLRDLFIVYVNLLLANSLFLRMIVRHSSFRVAAQWVLQLSRRLQDNLPYREAYRLSQRLEHAAATVGTAMETA